MTTRSQWGKLWDSVHDVANVYEGCEVTAAVSDCNSTLVLISAEMFHYI